jgi:large subunit ribosomal protein L4
VFGRDYNEALIHQVVVAFQANARQGNAFAEEPRRSQAHDEEAVAPKGYRPRSCRYVVVADVAWRRSRLPESPDENFTQKVNKKMYRAGMASILSQLAREGRLAVVDSFDIDAPKTKLLAQSSRTWAWSSVMVISDNVGDNLLLASRNLPNVLFASRVMPIPCRWSSTRRS